MSITEMDPGKPLMKPSTSNVVTAGVVGASAIGSVVVVNSEGARAPPDARCWLCTDPGCHDDLFKPCACSSYVHRTCFRQWRMGWINPRNYFCCPLCLQNYRIEKLHDIDTLSTKREIMNQFRIRMAKLWLGILLFIAGFIGSIGSIAYGADMQRKNIPVAIKFMLTSVIHGWPPHDAAASWRRDFENPDTAVWQYYTLLGALVTAIIVLVAFAMVGCTFDETDRSSNGCCDLCCRGTCRSNDCNCYWWYCYNPCPGNSCGSCECCNNCGSCSGGGGDCKCGDLGNAGEAIVILILVVIVIVLVSAIFVIILFAVRKWSLFHDRMSQMMLSQAAELEGAYVVLGEGESLRPQDAV